MATKVLKNQVNTRRKPAAKKVTSTRVQKSNAPSEVAIFLRRYVPFILLVFFAVLSGVLLFLAYRAVTATTVFNLKAIDVGGTNRVDAEEIRQIVKRLTAKTGVWNAEINDVQTEIEKIDWVKSAVVSRVLPDGLRIRVTERIPKTAVKIEERKFWIDEEGRKLGALDEKESPPLILQGWEEEKTEAQHRRNLERLAVFAKLPEEWKKSGSPNRVKAVGLENLQDVEAIVMRGETPVSIHLGKENWAKRLETALLVIDNYQQTGELEQVQYFEAKDGNITAVPKMVVKATEPKSTKKMTVR